MLWESMGSVGCGWVAGRQDSDVHGPGLGAGAARGCVQRQPRCGGRRRRQGAASRRAGLWADAHPLHQQVSGKPVAMVCCCFWSGAPASYTLSVLSDMQLTTVMCRAMHEHLPADPAKKSTILYFAKGLCTQLSCVAGNQCNVGACAVR